MRVSTQRCFGIVVVVAASVFAPTPDVAATGSQGRRADGSAVSIPHPMTVLLHADSVHAELDLSDDQKNAVEAAANQTDVALWRLRDAPLDERNHQGRALLDKLRTQLRTILSARQFERFDQLVLQALGFRTLLDPEVAAALSLSNDQQQRIRVTLERLADNVNGAARSGSEIERNILPLLTDRQRRVLARLSGPAFDLRAVPPVACRAPELGEVTAWLNSAPLSLESLRGKVVVVHFYTFGCINCIRNLPHYKGWYGRFDRDDVEIVGIHRPETEGERDIDRVRQKAAEAGQKYPIAVDNDARNWDLWRNRIWPSVYLVDKRGFIRYWWYGELNWQGAEGEQWMRARIAELIAEPEPKPR